MTGTVAIGIIGGTSGMGRWFADFLLARGFRVEVIGKEQERGIPDLAARSSVVVVSVPISATLEVIGEAGPHVKEDGLLMDLTSVKAGPVKRMLECSKAECAGLHPLFGPSVCSIEGENLALCPGRGRKWISWLRELLSSSGANVVETTPERHDEVMRFVQVLTHCCSILTGLTLHESGVGRDELLSFSTPAFRAQMGLVGKVFGPNPRLYADILTTNPGSREIMAVLERNLSKLKSLVMDGDAAGLTRCILEAKEVS